MGNLLHGITIVGKNIPLRKRNKGININNVRLEDFIIRSQG